MKWSLVVCVFCYSSYIAAQFYPEFYTLIPTAFILGLGAAPMWSAKCTYLTQTANRYKLRLFLPFSPSVIYVGPFILLKMSIKSPKVVFQVSSFCLKLLFYEQKLAQTNPR